MIPRNSVNSVQPSHGTHEKYALITGSSRGIGRGIALSLAESGVKVGVHYFQNEAAAKETLEQIRKCGSDGFSGAGRRDAARPDRADVSEAEGGIRPLGHLHHQRQDPRRPNFSAASRYHVRTMGRSVRFAGQKHFSSVFAKRFP